MTVSMMQCSRMRVEGPANLCKANSRDEHREQTRLSRIIKRLFHFWPGKGSKWQRGSGPKAVVSRPVSAALSRAFTVARLNSMKPEKKTASHTQTKQEKPDALETPIEHCLVNGGFPLLWSNKPYFKWLQNGDLLRSPKPAKHTHNGKDEHAVASQQQVLTDHEALCGECSSSHC